MLHVIVWRACSSESSRAELWPTASDGVRSAKVARAKLVVGRGGLEPPLPAPEPWSPLEPLHGYLVEDTSVGEAGGGRRDLESGLLTSWSKEM